MAAPHFQKIRCQDCFSLLGTPDVSCALALHLAGGGCFTTGYLGTGIMRTRENAGGLSCGMASYLLHSRREDSRSLLFTFKRFMENIFLKDQGKEMAVLPIFCLSYNKRLGDNSLASDQVSRAGFSGVCVLEMSCGWQCQPDTWAPP